MTMSQGIALAYNSVSKQADDRVKAAENFNPAGAVAAGYLAGLNVMMQQKQFQMQAEEAAFRREATLQQLDLQERGMTLRKNLADRQYDLDRDKLDTTAKLAREQQQAIHNRFRIEQAAKTEMLKEEQRQFDLRYGMEAGQMTLRSIQMAATVEDQKRRTDLAYADFDWRRADKDAQLEGMSAAVIAWNEQLIGGSISVEDYDDKMQAAFADIETNIKDPRAQIYARGFLAKQKEAARQHAEQQIGRLEEQLQLIPPNAPRRRVVEQKLNSLYGFALNGDARSVGDPLAQASSLLGIAPGGGGGVDPIEQAFRDVGAPPQVLQEQAVFKNRADLSELRTLEENALRLSQTMRNELSRGRTPAVGTSRGRGGVVESIPMSPAAREQAAAEFAKIAPRIRALREKLQKNMSPEDYRSIVGEGISFESGPGSE